MSVLEDCAYLEMAYSLAEKAKGWASPNPLVGAVCVKGGRILGCGYHERTGLPHAEIVALEQAGMNARGSTLYVTLEPCVHWGRTPPCVDAILSAKPRRVVVSSLDPNPIVCGRGIRKLRRAGVEVSSGLLADRNARLNEAYIKYITQGLPFLTIKAAVSLDARVASRSLDSRWISSPEAREYAHLLRGEHDAVMVGINTILRDDPLLTIRHPRWRGKRWHRFILDARLRFPAQARILSTLEEGSVTIFTSPRAPRDKEAALKKKGLKVVRMPAGSSGHVSLSAVLAWLGQHEISSVLVEGGSQLITSLIERKMADKLILILAPRLIGGEKAPAFLEGKGVRRVADAFQIRKVSTFSIGPDIVLEGYF